MAKRFKCPVCSGTKLQYGHIPAWMGMLRFIPRRWGKSYGVLSFVCLNCGYVGSYLHMKDVLDLRERWKKLRVK